MLHQLLKKHNIYKHVASECKFDKSIYLGVSYENVVFMGDNHVVCGLLTVQDYWTALKNTDYYCMFNPVINRN